DVAPTRSADDTKFESRPARSCGDTSKILPGLERADSEDVIAVRRRAGARERLIDAVPHDADPLFRKRQELDELALRELRNRDHETGGPQDVRNDDRPVHPRPGVEGVRVPEDGEIVHGDDERNGRADRAAIGWAMQDV